MKLSNDKLHNCADSECSNTFRKFKSTDKYCSYKCASKNVKPLKRTELNLSPKSIDKIKAKNKENKKKTDFQLEFERQSNKIKRRIVKEYGKIRCERCGTDRSIQFSTHHIIYRSEKPKHPALNTLENLIHLCFNCHEWFHKSKKNRNALVKKRNLKKLFGTVWGYEEN